MNEQKNEQKNKQTTSIGGSLALCCFLTVISQLPQIVELGLSSLLSRMIWLFDFGFLFILRLKSNKEMYPQKELIVPVILLMVMLIGGIIASLMNGASYINSSLFSVILLSFFVLLVGFFVGDIITKQDLKKCGNAYIIASIVLAIDVYIMFFRGADITQQTYIYKQKNSAAVILFTALLIAFVQMWYEDNKIRFFINLAVIAFFTFMIFIMKTRAMILCFPVVIIIALLKAPVGRKLKIPLLFIVALFACLLANENFYDLIINTIILGGKANGDLNDISTGRSDQWLYFFDYLSGKELLGDGRTELESLILTAPIQWGIPIGVLIIIYAMLPMIIAIRQINKSKGKNEDLWFLLLLIAVVYFIDAIFEQLAPFGPGVRCFYLWLLTGIGLAKKSARNNREG